MSAIFYSCGSDSQPGQTINFREHNIWITNTGEHIVNFAPFMSDETGVCMQIAIKIEEHGYGITKWIDKGTVEYPCKYTVSYEQLTHINEKPFLITVSKIENLNIGIGLNPSKKTKAKAQCCCIQ